MEMEKLTNRLSQIEQQLADGELYDSQNKEKLTALLNEQVQLKKNLETVETDWLTTQEELELLIA